MFDGATGTPLAGASVRIDGTDQSAVTDERGVYRFPGLAPGSYTVTLRVRTVDGEHAVAKAGFITVEELK